MSEFKVALGAVFLCCMLGLWFALMVKGRREDFENHPPAPNPPRRLG